MVDVHLHLLLDAHGLHVQRGHVDGLGLAHVKQTRLGLRVVHPALAAGLAALRQQVRVAVRQHVVVDSTPLERLLAEGAVRQPEVAVLPAQNGRLRPDGQRRRVLVVRVAVEVPAQAVHGVLQLLHLQHHVHGVRAQQHVDLQRHGLPLERPGGHPLRVLAERVAGLGVEVGGVHVVVLGGQQPVVERLPLRLDDLLAVIPRDVPLLLLAVARDERLVGDLRAGHSDTFGGSSLWEALGEAEPYVDGDFLRRHEDVVSGVIVVERGLCQLGRPVPLHQVRVAQQGALAPGAVLQDLGEEVPPWLAEGGVDVLLAETRALARRLEILLEQDGGALLVLVAGVPAAVQVLDLILRKLHRHRVHTLVEAVDVAEHDVLLLGLVDHHLLLLWLLDLDDLFLLDLDLRPGDLVAAVRLGARPASAHDVDCAGLERHVGRALVIVARGPQLAAHGVVLRTTGAALAELARCASLQRVARLARVGLARGPPVATRAQIVHGAHAAAARDVLGPLPLEVACWTAPRRAVGHGALVTAAVGAAAVAVVGACLRHAVLLHAVLRPGARGVEPIRRSGPGAVLGKHRHRQRADHRQRQGAGDLPVADDAQAESA
mmetsp:Transcript_82174/g.229699  ORF Transcript_82174/g.229699 Transcript_82174/m.229699 type:complete len:603 (-) Transcript_82174:270-2078(-)